MSDYIKLFKSHVQYNAYINSENAILPNVSYCENNNEVHYNPIDFSKQYLATVARENGTITFEVVGNYDDELGREVGVSSEIFEKVAYSTDNGETWTQMLNNSSDVGNIALSVNVNAGDKVLWKGKGVAVFDYNGDWDACTHFKSTCNVNVSGNILSMMLWDDFYGVSDISEDLAVGTFCAMFADPFAFVGCGEDTSEQGYPNYLHIVNAKDLCLPDVIMTEDCYEGLFAYCTSLTTAPELPAITLANYCYYQMFQGCSSLTTAPSVLPATTLATQCYEHMFKGCTSLVTAPELPATTLAERCYYNMFYGCTSLTSAPVLPATTLANGCYNSMFESCTSLTTAPELPATTLVTECYSYMFQGCSSLNYIKAMFTTTPSTSYTNSWVQDVAASGTFVKNSAAQWNVSGNSGVPNGWTVQTASA